MNKLLQMTFISLVGAVMPSVIALGAEAPLPESPRPQPQARVPKMLALTWTAGPPMPQGLQDNRVTLIHGHLVSVGGFCSGTDNDWKPGMYGTL